MFLSGYKLMWLLVMFDLPVIESEERKVATKFRNFLLDEGFYMAQYSVYMKVLSGKVMGEAVERRIHHALPLAGRVDIISITDKQYENMRSFIGHKYHQNKKSNSQLILF